MCSTLDSNRPWTEILCIEFEFKSRAPMIATYSAFGAMLPWEAFSCIARRTIGSQIMRSHGGHVNQDAWLKGVIFDMDGTITIPAIDFAEMRYVTMALLVTQLRCGGPG